MRPSRKGPTIPPLDEAYRREEKAVSAHKTKITNTKTRVVFMTDSSIMSHGAVGTPHPEAAAAGLDILKKNGNAIDAAVAAVVTLCVVQPYNVGIGGYGGCMVIYSADEGKVTAIDFDSCAPIAFHLELYKTNDAADIGYLAVSVPGVVRGLALALSKYGTMSWKDVSARALGLAENGFKITALLAGTLQNLAKTTDPVSFKAQFPDGKVPKAGGVFVQRDLAALLKLLGDKGPDAFYQGKVPETIVRQVKGNGGILSVEDFYEYAPRVTKPIHIEHSGYDIYAPLPPSGALSSLQALKIMEQSKSGEMEPFSTRYLHTTLESLKLAWKDRMRYLGDPDFVDVPIDKLLSDEHAADCASNIKKDGVIHQPMPESVETHTVHVVTCDRNGNLVSLTATQGEPFGSKVVIGGLGLAIGHGMSRFDFIPGHPNNPRPGKRMQHNMSPVIVLKDGKPYSAVGLPGGRKIVSVTSQLIMNLLDFHMSPSDAIAAPRVHTEGGEPVTVSDALPEKVIQDLQKIGHRVHKAKAIGGPASALVIDAAKGSVVVASEAGSESVGVL